MKKLALIIISLASFIIPLLAGEYFLRARISSWPVSKMSFFHAGHHPLFQSFSLDQAKKDGWNLIVGDSHIAGLSDELLSSLDQEKDFTFPAEKLGALTNSQVLGIGSPGAGPMTSLLQKPSLILDYLKSTYLHDLPAPKNVILVLYEGNDFDNDQKDVVIPFLKNQAEPELDRLSALDHFSKKRLQKEENFTRSLLLKFGVTQFLIGDLINGIVRDRLDFKSDSYYRSEEGKTWKGSGKLPDNIQGPAPELSKLQLDHVFKTIDYTFKKIKDTYPKSRILLVYLPSTFSSYNVTDENLVYLRSYWGGKSQSDIKKQLNRHHELVKRTELTALKAGLMFHDSTPDLLIASKNKMIHGPRDWDHLNAIGMDALLKSIAAKIHK